MNKKVLISAIATTLLSGNAFATNGMFAHGYGTINRALAGAGVAATNQGSLSSANNPASMAFVGNQMDIGVELFAPRRSFTNDNAGTFPISTGGEVESENNWFLIPSFGYSMALGGGSNFGVAVYGNGGMNTEYDASNNSPNVTNANGALNGGTASSDILQLFTNLSFASKLSDSSSWGVSVILAAQSLKVEGLSAFTAVTETNISGGASDDLTDNGRDWAYGAGLKLGFLTALTNTLSLGVSAQSKIYMTDHDDYQDLLTEDDDLDNAATATIGLQWAITPKSRILVDYQYIWYSNVNTLSDDDTDFNACPGAGGTNSAACIGGNDGPGFGWDNMGVVKIGWEWEANPEWTWRVGFSHGNQPVDNNQTLFNILAPATVENHITFGFTNKLSKDSDFNFAAMYAPRKEISGKSGLLLDVNQDGIGDPVAGDTELSMHQYSIEASWSSRF